MAGKTIEKARTAQRAFTDKPTRGDQSFSKLPVPTASVHVATSEAPTVPVPSSTPDMVVIGNATYMLAPPAQSSTACLALPQSARLELADSDDETAGTGPPYPFHSWIALSEPAKVTIDWNEYYCSTASSDMTPGPIQSKTSRAFVALRADLPFVLDSDASVHISPERSDFKNLCPIVPPHRWFQQYFH